MSGSSSTIRMRVAIVAILAAKTAADLKRGQLGGEGAGKPLKSQGNYINAIGIALALMGAAEVRHESVPGNGTECHRGRCDGDRVRARESSNRGDRGISAAGGTPDAGRRARRAGGRHAR